MGPIRFQLVDSEGQKHEYTLTKHLGTEGVSVALRVMSLLSGPITEALVAFLGADGALAEFAKAGTEFDLTKLDLEKLAPALEGINLGALAKQLARVLADRDTACLLTTDLMIYVSRDGKELRNRGAFDKAFTGNYLELFKLAMEVITKNGFLPLAPT